MDTRRFSAGVRRVWNRSGDVLLAVALFAASIYLYLQTLAPSVVTLFDDSLEFPLVAHRLAIAHPTGYPFYTLLARLLALGPGRNVAWSVNLLSAIAGALTVALVYGLTRQLTKRRLPALLGAAALAVSPVFWSQAVIAEVYTLAGAFVAGVLLVALRWARQPLLPVEPFSLILAPPTKAGSRFLAGEGAWARVPEGVRRAGARLQALYRRFLPAVPPSRRLRLHPRIYALAAMFGLSLTHHRLMLVLAPTLLVYILLVERRVLSRAGLLGPEYPDKPRWRQVVGRPAVLLLLCLAGPLVLYLYLPWRGSTGSLDGTYTNTLVGFVRWVMASSYTSFLSDNPLARDLGAGFYGGLFWQQFGPAGLALALVGLIGLVRRPKELVLTGLAFVSYVLFAVVYRVPDIEVFAIPAFLVAAVWVGAGLDYAADLLRMRGASLTVRRLLAVALVLIFVAAVIQPGVIATRNFPDLDLSRQWTARDFGFYVLQQPLPDRATVVGVLGEMTLLRYMQETVGLRPDIETVAADDEQVRLNAVKVALADGGAVFITRPLPGLTKDYALGAVTGMIDVAGELETLLRVAAPEYDLTDPPRAIDVTPVPGLELLGYGLRQHDGHWQAWERLKLWWRAPQGLVEPLKISARLLDASGMTVAAADAEPVSGSYPTTLWRAGEVVADAYEIPLPPGLPPGQYTPVVVIYEPDTGEERGRVELEPVRLEGNPARPPRRALEDSVDQAVYARFADVELLGYSAPDATVAIGSGNALQLTLLWQAREEPSGDWRATFWLEGDAEYSLGTVPLGGRFPASEWAPGQLVRQWPNLQVPAHAPPGPYQLVMRVTRDGQPVPWGRWWFPMGSDLDLGTVRVER
ncbi:protein O-mannosyl-transferase family [Chloroflexota bacterium]